jgi:hypothetical protein
MLTFTADAQHKSTPEQSTVDIIKQACYVGFKERCGDMGWVWLLALSLPSASYYVWAQNKDTCQNSTCSKSAEVLLLLLLLVVVVVVLLLQ